MSNYLVIGSGGREHAIAWKIATESDSNRVWVSPGNAGIARDPAIQDCVNLSPSPDDSHQFEPIVRFAHDHNIDAVIVGPEAPLADGLADYLNAHNIPVFGPSAQAAQLETSKAFAKELLVEAGIKTADYQLFDNATDALNYLQNAPHPIVIKADGLAAGKGVFVSQNLQQSQDAIDAIFTQKQFGDSGERVVIEQFLEGIEVSVIVITNGDTIVDFVLSRDHKRLLDNDKGPNTGGMGALAPFGPDEASQKYNFDFYDNHHTSLDRDVIQNVFEPLLNLLKKRGIDYTGFLYAGIIVTNDGPYVLEFNVRMGDPETEAILYGMTAPLAPFILNALNPNHSVDGLPLPTTNPMHACTVVMASSEYPKSGGTGHEIKGIEDAESVDGVKVFCAGVAQQNGHLINSGGRVLAVTARDTSRDAARSKAYDAVKKISFHGAQYRTDIAK